MNFDFNLVLVPLVLVLGFIYLLDKLKLKQRKRYLIAYKALADAEKTLAEKSKNLENLLKKHQITYQTLDKLTLDTLLNQQQTLNQEKTDTNEGQQDNHKQNLDELKLAYDEYQQAKQAVDKASIKEREQEEFILIRWTYEFFPIILVLFIVRAFIIEPFNIPSSSMVPTLYTGDFIAVNKSAYGIRLPLIFTKVLDTGSPKHGDVAVFRYPDNPKIYYIKRVIGLPNDVVSYDNGVISVNGIPVPTDNTNFVANPDLTAQLYPSGTMENGDVLTKEEAKELGDKEEGIARYSQEQQGEHTHLVRYLNGINSSQYAPFLQQKSPEVVSSQGKKWQVTVPEGQYFVMGDNRDRSADSRWWGFVPDANLAGKAVYIWMHKPTGLFVPTFSRNGKID